MAQTIVATRNSAQALPGDVPAQAAPWRLQGIAVLVVLMAMLCQIWLPAFRETNFGIAVDNGTLVVRDMAAHLTFVREFWLGRADYSVDRHVHITNHWAGQNVDRALPFGYSPTMLVLLAPLSVLPTVWGFAIWTMISGTAVWWLSGRGRTVFLLGVLVLLSPLSLVCLALGQTSLVSAAGLVFLMLRHHQWAAAGDGDRWSWRLAPDVVVLWALTAKPPLALVAGVALLAGRRWKTVAAALALTVATTLLLTPKLGAEWIGQYLHLLSHYDRETADAAFAWSLRPDHMTNLRALLWSSGIVGDHAACQFSTAAWLVAMTGVVAAGIAGKLRRGIAWPLAVVAYLLFCPHLTSTEDLHLVVLVAFLAVGEEMRTLTAPQRAALCLAVVVVFLPPDVTMQAGALRSALIFVLKVVAAVCVCLPGTPLRSTASRLQARCAA
jgi:hypothetical protein